MFLIAIYILLSIKTRIETIFRIKAIFLLTLIYILLSIKTRIETNININNQQNELIFISYYPLKQGLKHIPTVLHPAPRRDLYPTIH